MKKLFIRDLEARFSFSILPIMSNWKKKPKDPKPITTMAIGEEGDYTTLALGEEGF